MTKTLIIVGAGDSGKEIYAWGQILLAKNNYSFKGFLDDDHPDAFAKITDYMPTEDDVFVCSVGTPKVRLRLTTLLEERGAVFINWVHPSALLLTDITSCRGLVIAPFVYMANEVKLANHVFINVAASIGHHVEIGVASNISSHCDLTGHVKLGARVFMGSHACIIPGKTIGDDAIVGGGSAVMRHVSAHTTVLGVPAKRLL